ncbi:glycerol-3-phosphate dehydrogenase [Shewanella sp. VB17]|nr:glycerol-3-phosphate dehydrogenase [Shewanella sp. VB17]
MIYDLLVIGGGINGAGIARDAAGRGLSVLLCEKDDLAQHTSSASTKLIHGGLRYLEHYEFSLVRKSLKEREILLRSAPHIIGPLRFIMPHAPEQRPTWLIRAGLFLYDHLAKREILPGSESIKLGQHLTGEPLKKGFKQGFAYSDAWVQDARLVVLNALDARERSAHILTQTEVIAARREGQYWHVSLKNSDGEIEDVIAKGVVNAAGPWVDNILGQVTQTGSAHKMRLVKGSHIIVKRLFDHPYAYIFQNPDKRIIFAIPYENDFTLIGTTDVEYQGDPGEVTIDHAEVEYLCQMSNRYFEQQIMPSDVIATMSGVRPLFNDEANSAASVTRDYSLELCFENNAAPLVSIFGGKLTSYRKLAEEAIDLIAPHLGNKQGRWTEGECLPGGDIPNMDMSHFIQLCQERYPWIPATIIVRYAKSYGTRLHQLIGSAKSLDQLGIEIAPTLFEAEVMYLINVEWAKTAQDIIWRRSKLQLHLQDSDIAKLEDWLAVHFSSAAALTNNLAWSTSLTTGEVSI